jgi:S-sulfosulfanyl-L-cysteine sulfohydrolase
MTTSRRSVLRALAAASALGFPAARLLAAQGAGADPYEVPDYGNVTLLHITDTHAQLNPVWWREPDTNIGVGAEEGRPPHLAGRHAARYYGVAPGSAAAYALDCLDFAELARRYGRVGGFAHIATLVKRTRAERPGKVLLLDGGDSWQGSATALWTKGADMAGAQNLLGVAAMVGHWDFTYGEQRVQEIIKHELKFPFLSQNVFTQPWGDPVFPPYAIREVGGRAIAVIGQSFPYTPIANPRYLVPNWSFGIHARHLQKVVEECREKRRADCVVLLSHNGADVDVKLAGQVSGIDVILGGHTHDIMGPRPVVVNQTVIVNTSTNGKVLARFDLDVGKGRLNGWRLHYLPVLADLVAADAEMAAYIEGVRAPYKARLEEPLAVTESLLWRRGNFNGPLDQLLLQALIEELDCEAAFSPGFRWGPCKLPGDTVTFEDVMAQTAITYPQVTVRHYTGAEVKSIMEQVADNLYNKDPYYVQGGDMVRVGNVAYTIDPAAGYPHYIRDLRIAGRPVEAHRRYKFAGWAEVSTPVAGEPVWDLYARWLRRQKRVRVERLDLPRLTGDMKDNPGIADPQAYGV